MSTAVVTGASKGIGAAIAIALARRGHDLVGIARDASDLQVVGDAIAALGASWTQISCDLRDLGAVDAAGDQIVADHPDVRVLVNNAGAGIGPTSMLHTSLDAYRWILRLNVVAPYLLIRKLAPAMEAAGGGRVVNISSAVANYRVPSEATSVAYASAKGALGGVTRQTARLLASRGITINAVLPGDVLTYAGAEWFNGMNDDDRAVVLGRVPRRQLSSPEEVAKIVADLCDDDAGAVIGVSLDVNSGAWIR